MRILKPTMCCFLSCKNGSECWLQTAWRWTARAGPRSSVSTTAAPTTTSGWYSIIHSSDQAKSSGQSGERADLTHRTRYFHLYFDEILSFAPMLLGVSIANALESGQEARIVEIDFSAAVDRVNHQGILY